MNNILLNTDQIIDLIFEKYTLFDDDTRVCTHESAMQILHAIEERLVNGKMSYRKAELLRKPVRGAYHRV